MSLKNLTNLNGFDSSNLDNAKQNNYAWSMSELNDYIYVGTGKNIMLWPVETLGKYIPNFKIPSSLKVDNYNTTAEIWRYKKDGSRPWEKVFKAPDGIEGFRFMITHSPYGPRKALYAAGSSNSQKSKIKIFKTFNGINWVEVQTDNLNGNTSRSMIVHNNKIYIATATELLSAPYLYSSSDPEVEGWKTELDPTLNGFDPSKNPQGSLYNIQSFNNHIYVSTNSSEGVQIWRTRELEPKLNDWILIGDKGFGNKDNTWSLSMTVFRNHLYFSTTTELPKGYFSPKGADIIRIDKFDNWELIVGGTIKENLNPATKKSKSGYSSGFFNPLNIYVWQLQEYKNVLYATTFDHGINLQSILDIILLNKKSILKIGSKIGITPDSIEKLISELKNILSILTSINYPFGFDIFASYDGIRFIPVSLDGLGNPTNYGGRILYVDSKNELYIGTANPYEGCEVWKTNTHLIPNYKVDLSKLNLNNISDTLKSLQKLLTLLSQNN